MSVGRAKLKWNGYGWAAHRNELAMREDIWTWLAGQLGMPSLLATPARDLNEISLPESKLRDDQFSRLANIVGAECVRSDMHERAYHTRARDYPGLLALRSGDLRWAPDAVCRPRSGDEVMDLLAFATDSEIAVVPWGAGSAGMDNAKAPSIAIDLSGMSRVVNADDAVFEAGITGPALENALQSRGRILGHRPEAFEFSTLGGWIAWGGRGAASLRYGTPRDWLLSAKIVTPLGLIQADEADLRNLIIGSKGTLGIITEAVVQTVATPHAREKRTFLFRDMETAANVLLKALEDEMPLASASLSDQDETDFWQNFYAAGQKSRNTLGGFYRGLRGFDRQAATLSVSFEGGARAVDAAVAHLANLAAKANAITEGNNETLTSHSPGYLRDALLERGAAMETFHFDVSWEKVWNLKSALRGTLQDALAENGPRPGARGVTLMSISALSYAMARLTLTYIFPRLLDDELKQWKALQTVVAHVAQIKSEDAAGIKIRRAVKGTLDPRNILPAIN